MSAHRFAALVLTTLAACTPSSDVRIGQPQEDDAQAEETRVVFAAVLCAYDDARAPVGAAGDVQLENEIGRLRRIFRAVGAEPRPCADPLIRRLAGCIHVWQQANEIVSEWRSEGECTSTDVARYK